MKKSMAFLMAAMTAVSLVGCAGGTPADKPVEGSTAASQAADKGQESGQKVYPKGTITIYGTGSPQYRQQYFETWLENHRDIAPEVSVECVQTESMADSREKITMTALSGALEDLPEAAVIDAVNVMDLANAGLLLDETEFLSPLADQMVSGALNDGTVGGKIYGLPDSVRPQVLFYNQEIFDRYEIDPAMMSTMDGYAEAGRLLKEKSGGEVYLSYIDPGANTWRYWGRRGLMPQAGARIWDDQGNVVIGQDEGTKLALGLLDTLNQEGLLLKSAIMQPALYDAINNQQVATFYIGAFWDQFLRQNCQATAGQWRVMAAPEFEEVKKAGAPVSQYTVLLDKGDNVYRELFEQMWYDYTFDAQSKEAYVNSMEEQNAPYSNPVSLELLEDAFWKAPSDFYGGQSFREMEGKCLANGAENLVVTPQDAEADVIISAELETYVAGKQTMEEAIRNMDKNLKAKISKAEITQ